MKRPLTEWKKISANYVTNRGLTSRTHNLQLKKLNSNETNNPVKKWAADKNTNFSKAETQVANKHMKNAQDRQLPGRCK